MSCGCDANFTPICENSNPETLEIYARRVISKWDPVGGETILFDKKYNEDGTVVEPYEKVPLRFCIKDLKVENSEPVYYPVRCIGMTKLVGIDPSQEFICNHKAKLTIAYKVFLCVEYKKGAETEYDVIVLPKDNDRFCYLDYDNEPISAADLFPIELDGESLTVDDTAYPTQYIWTKYVPLDDPNWIGEVPCSVFKDPTLESEVIIKCSKIIYDVLEPCACNGSADDAGTRVDLSVIADIMDRIGILQGICINGTVLDNCQY